MERRRMPWAKPSGATASWLPWGIEQAPRVEGPGRLDNPGCIPCSTRRLECDFAGPRCSGCIADNIDKCSYEWTLKSIIALFPPEFDMSKKISLGIADEVADHGAFGKVYHTSLKKNGGDVAVKVLFQNKRTPHRVLLLALREALTWSELKHENIAPLIGVADYSKICKGASPQLSLVSPWMAAGNVMECLATEPKTDCRLIMLDIADAVCYLHTRVPDVVVHGDIRGSNILVHLNDGHPRACLTDFGLSFIIEESGRTQKALSSTSTGRAGHPRWLAPERLYPENFNLSSYTSKSAASDVFEMCRTFLEILSRHHPFIGVNNFKVARMVEEGKHPERPSERDGVHHALTDVMWSTLQRGWTQDRLERPSAVEIRAVIVSEILIDKGSSDLELPSLGRLFCLWAETISSSVYRDASPTALSFTPGGGTISPLPSGPPNQFVVKEVLRLYDPKLQDELHLTIGEKVRVIEEFADCWAMVERVGSLAEGPERGVVPIDCLGMDRMDLNDPHPCASSTGVAL